MARYFALLLVLVLAGGSTAVAPAQAHNRHHAAHHHHRNAHSHSATVTRTHVRNSAFFVTIRAATGATATVGRDVAGKFQALVNKLEAAGARIAFMGGVAHRRIAGSAQWSKHSVGHAVDVCQLGRNVVDASCRLPRAATAIAASVGLKHGGAWQTDPDRGHFEVRGPNPGNSRGRAYASARTHSKRVATNSNYPAIDRAVGAF